MEAKIVGEDGCLKSADEAWKCEDAVAVNVDDPQWVKYMEAKLASKSKNFRRSHRFTICRVPPDIRRVDSVAYDPLIVSIGPYHRGTPSLHQMEEVKWRNLKKFHDGAGNDFNKYLKAMKDIEPKARACYSGNIKMKPNEFIEMMLLDGLFIIQLLKKKEKAKYFLFQLVGISSYGIDPGSAIDGMLCRIGHDMLLLENQLPFFVLQRLWILMDPQGGDTLWQEASDFIRLSAMRFLHEWDFHVLTEILAEEEERYKYKIEPALNEGVLYHFLHLVCLFLKPTRNEKPEAMECSAELPAARGKIYRFRKSMDIMKWFQSMECTRKLPAVKKKMKTKILSFLSSFKFRKERPPPLKVIPSAVELDEAGVKFKCVNAQSFLDVKFEHGTMKMPRLSVQYFTKSLFRNFIAFEQCFPTRYRHFTSYCSFMDYLVNTRRDVEILKQSKIIENRVGSDKEVALLFNDLCKGIFVSDLKNSYLKEPFEQVTEHTKKTWPKWRAKLKHDYFSNPWAIISLIAATFVIFLTSVQAYKAAFP